MTSVETLTKVEQTEAAETKQHCKYDLTDDETDLDTYSSDDLYVPDSDDESDEPANTSTMSDKSNMSPVMQDIHTKTPTSQPNIQGSRLLFSKAQNYPGKKLDSVRLKSVSLHELQALSIYWITDVLDTSVCSPPYEKMDIRNYAFAVSMILRFNNSLCFYSEALTYVNTKFPGQTEFILKSLQSFVYREAKKKGYSMGNLPKDAITKLYSDEELSSNRPDPLPKPKRTLHTQDLPVNPQHAETGSTEPIDLTTTSKNKRRKLFESQGRPETIIEVLPEPEHAMNNPNNQNGSSVESLQSTTTNVASNSSIPTVPTREYIDEISGPTIFHQPPEMPPFPPTQEKMVVLPEKLRIPCLEFGIALCPESRLSRERKAFAVQEIENVEQELSLLGITPTSFFIDDFLTRFFAMFIMDRLPLHPTCVNFWTTFHSSFYHLSFFSSWLLKEKNLDSLYYRKPLYSVSTCTLCLEHANVCVYPSIPELTQEFSLCYPCKEICELISKINYLLRTLDADKSSLQELRTSRNVTTLAYNCKLQPYYMLIRRYASEFLAKMNNPHFFKVASRPYTK